MDPKIIELDALFLAGMSFFGDPFDSSSPWTEANQIGQLWDRMMTYLDKNAARLEGHCCEHAFYEVHIFGPETAENGLFEVFVGLQIDDLACLPINLVGKALRPGCYAVFTLKGSQIMSDWEQSIAVWLKSNGFRESCSFNFQYYDARFKGMDQIEDSCLDVYIPVEKI